MKSRQPHITYAIISTHHSPGNNSSYGNVAYSPALLALSILQSLRYICVTTNLVTPHNLCDCNSYHRGRGTALSHSLDFSSAARFIASQERVLRLIDLPPCAKTWLPQFCTHGSDGTDGAECVVPEVDRQSASANILTDLGVLGRRNRRVSLWPAMETNNLEHLRCLSRLQNASSVWWVVAPGDLTAAHLTNLGSQVLYLHHTYIHTYIQCIFHSSLTK